MLWLSQSNSLKENCSHVEFTRKDPSFVSTNAASSCPLNTQHPQKTPQVLQKTKDQNASVPSKTLWSGCPQNIRHSEAAWNVIDLYDLTEMYHQMMYINVLQAHMHLVVEPTWTAPWQIFDGWPNTWETDSVQVFHQKDRATLPAFLWGFTYYRSWSCSSKDMSNLKTANMMYLSGIICTWY